MGSLIPGTTPESILTENREVLARGGSRHMEWGGMYLHMPTSHVAYWKERYPDLDSSDGEVKLRAWERFLKSSESKPYRVSAPKYM